MTINDEEIFLIEEVLETYNFFYTVYTYENTYEIGI